MFGMLVGAALFQKYRTWPSRPSYHKLLTFCCFALIVLNFLFIHSKSAFYKRILEFPYGYSLLFCGNFNRHERHRLNQYVNKLFLMLTASFGIGAFCAPILIRIFGTNAYFIFAIVLGSVILLILYLPSP